MKRFSLFLAVMMLALASQAQLLWKVSGNGLARPSYIMGTYHFAPATMMEKIPGMNQALEGCDVVVGEIDKEEMTSQETQMKMGMAMVAPADSTLDMLFTPEEYAVVEKVFEEALHSQPDEYAQTQCHQLADAGTPGYEIFPQYRGERVD